jgi:hypothetical protein
LASDDAFEGVCNRVGRAQEYFGRP